VDVEQLLLFCSKQHCVIFVAACTDCDEVMNAESFMAWEKQVPVKLHMAESGPLSEKPICVMTALKTTAEKYPDHPALGFYTHILYYLQLFGSSLLFWFV